MEPKTKQIKIELSLKWTVIYIAVALTCLYIIFGGRL
jgi:hypothetical protein